MKYQGFCRSTAAVAGLLLLPLSLAIAPAPAAQASSCSITRESYSKLAPDLVRQVQDALAYFGLYANRIDNIVGLDTRAGLATYCRQRGMHVGADAASRQALLDELLLDSAVDRVYRGWRGILASPGFAPWAAGQADSKEINNQIKSGTPAQIIDIIDRYLKYRPAPAKPGLASWADNQANSYRLAATDLATIAASHGMLEKLAKMKGAGFQDKADFFAQIDELLAAEEPSQIEAAHKLIDNYAERDSVVILGESGLARLSAARVPYDLLSDLAEFKDPGYSSRAEAETALRVLLFGTDKPENVTTEKIAKTSQAAAPVTTKAGTASAPESSKSAAENNAKWLPLILVQLEEHTAYRLSDESWSKLTAAVGALPDYVPAILPELAEVDYPLRELFIDAAEARISARLAALLSAASAEVRQRHLQQVDDSLFATLKKKEFPDELANILSPLKGKAYATESELGKDIDGLQKTETARFASYMEFIAKQARKQHPFDPTKKPMLTPVADCKCLPNKMKRQIYGFYPFWQAGQAHSVDFASLSRLGYYALGFANDGSLKLPGGDVAEYFGQAFSTVRQYETSVDYVISHHDWSAWAAQSPAERSAAFATLTTDIAGLLGTRPRDTLSRLKPYISLGSYHPPLADGVTLFFEHYPEDEEYANEFHDFLGKLRSTLAGSKKTVNLMLPHSALGQGAFTYRRLKDLAPTDDKDAAKQLFILVLLEEPYTDTKKRLRQEVEQQLRGTDRRNILRMMIPVIVPDGKALIDDDVIYMGDNFGGIGFWPPPTPAAEAETLPLLPDVPIVKREYYPDSTNQTSAICGIVCPHRWLFRLALDIFLVAALVMLAVLVRCCECRAGFRLHFIPILGSTVVPLFLLFMALLSCDPSWSKLADGNQPLYLILLAIIIYAIWDYWQRKQEIP